jgi:hypothetical protein
LTFVASLTINQPFQMSDRSSFPTTCAATATSIAKMYGGPMG